MDLREFHQRHVRNLISWGQAWRWNDVHAEIASRKHWLHDGAQGSVYVPGAGFKHILAANLSLRQVGLANIQAASITHDQAPRGRRRQVPLASLRTAPGLRGSCGIRTAQRRYGRLRAASRPSSSAGAHISTVSSTSRCTTPNAVGALCKPLQRQASVTGRQWRPGDATWAQPPQDSIR